MFSLFKFTICPSDTFLDIFRPFLMPHRKNKGTFCYQSLVNYQKQLLENRCYWIIELKFPLYVCFHIETFCPSDTRIKSIASLVVCLVRKMHPYSKILTKPDCIGSTSSKNINLMTFLNFSLCQCAKFSERIVISGNEIEKNQVFVTFY